MTKIVLVIVVFLATILSALPSNLVQDKPNNEGYAPKAANLLHKLTSHDLTNAAKRKDVLLQVIDNQENTIMCLGEATKRLDNFVTYQDIIRRARELLEWLKNLKIK